jgi:hypothetical protein
MDGLRVLRNTQVVLLGVCIAVATIVASVILSRAFLQFQKATREVITVTGSATKLIDSDFVVWSATVAVRDPDRANGYKALRATTDKAIDYLKSNGIDPAALEISQVNVVPLYKKGENGMDTHELVDYRLTQTIGIESKDVAKITGISRQIMDLVEQGIDIDSSAPRYHYLGLDSLKLEMIAKATENAKQRAQNMAQATGNRIGPIRTARMGVFQITSPTSTDVSDYGVNDTYSIEKKVMAVVNATFAIE